MIKVLFICHGNICRSPMAEFIMKHLTEKENVYITSRATSFEEEGNGIYPPAKRVLKENNIPFDNHFATRFNKKEYNEYDYIIVMDDYNMRNLLRIIENDNYHKVYKLNYFSNSTKDIDDPWYTGEFDKCFNEIYKACKNFYEYLKINQKL